MKLIKNVEKKLVPFAMIFMSGLLCFTGCSNGFNVDDDVSANTASVVENDDDYDFEEIMNVGDRGIVTSVRIADGYLTDSKGNHVSPTLPVEVLSPDFFITADNKVFNPKISNFLSLLASDVYDNVSVDIGKGMPSADDNLKIYESLGMKDVKVLREDGKFYSVISHREYKVAGKKYSVIFETVQGTDGSFEQWNDNFDMGADTEGYYAIQNNNGDWRNKKNHRGFDIAANHLKAKVNQYMKESVPSSAEKILVITGHSRGASISNILGANYEAAEGIKTFTYTFAAAAVTTDMDAASKFQTIFNIVNEDDLVPAIPLANWGFTLYGTKKSLSIKTSCAADWANTIGRNYVSADAQSATADKGFLTNVVSSRENVYRYNGTKEIDGYSIPLTDTTEEAIRSELERYKLSNFCDLTLSADGKKLEGKIKPAFALNLVPALLEENKGGYLQAMNFMSKYVGALHKNYSSFVGGFVMASITDGVTYSHTPISYVILSTNL